ncbi:MAG: response regulator [bacterium]|nr:response regulator [bacterium]
MKILVIDDDGELMAGITRTFSDLGEERVVAVGCYSIEEAIKAIAQHKPTHLFLDDCLKNPGDGLEIARQLYQQGRRLCKIFSTTGTTDIILLSSYQALGIELVPKGELVSKIKILLHN